MMQKCKNQKKNVMSIKFLPIILGPDILGFFLLENPMPIKFLLLGGGCWVFLGRGVGGSANFIFMGVGI